MSFLDAHIEKYNAIERSEEIKKIRALFISAIISYPLWGLLAAYMAPETHDPLWQRLALSGITFVFLLLTFFVKRATSFYYVIVWLYSYHLFFLYWMNLDSSFHFISNLIQFTILILCFPTKKSAQIYTYTKFAAVLIFALLTYRIGTLSWFFLLSMATIGHYVMTILVQHFNVMDTLKKSRLEFDLALSSMLEGIILLDVSGKINFFNQTAAKLLNLNVDSDIGRSYLNTCLVNNACNEQLSRLSEERNPLIKSIAAHQPLKSLVMGINFDHEVRWLQFNVQPLKEQGHKHSTLLSFSDISLLKKNQEFKEMKQAQLAMKAKLNSLFTVAGGMAHEINNPLGIIVARLQHMERIINGPHLDTEGLKNNLMSTNRAAYRIAKIVNTLLSFSRSNDEGPMLEVKLATIIDETLELCSEKFKNNQVQLRMEKIPDVTLCARSRDLSQVFLSILTNSFEAIESQREKWISLSFRQSEAKIFISITDSGPEVSAEIKSRIMEPFFTTKEVGKGAGLGLSVSKAIIEEHNGSLTVDKKASNVCLLIELPTL